jgi:hypothetical protein
MTFQRMSEHRYGDMFKLGWWRVLKLAKKAKPHLCLIAIVINGEIYPFVYWEDEQRTLGGLKRQFCKNHHWDDILLLHHSSSSTVTESDDTLISHIESENGVFVAVGERHDCDFHKCILD